MPTFTKKGEDKSISDEAFVGDSEHASDNMI
jgi:hypothetical protein